MKIAITSTYDWIQKENNYGSIMQYYALQEYLKELGHEAYWVRYNPIEDEINNHGKVSKLTYIRKKGVLIKNFIRTIFKRDIVNLKNSCTKSFKLFMKDHLNLSPHEYLSWESICQNPPDADVYVTGSDQVWLGLNKANYLEFVPEGKKRYSYGASFGRQTYVQQDDYDLMSSMLKKFIKISVREKEGVDICRKAGRTDAVHVVDPVLLQPKIKYLDLIKQYEKSVDKQRNPYVFSYFLRIKSPSQVHWSSIREFAKGKSLDLKVVPIQGTEFIFPEKNVDMPSPIKWLQLIAGANYVITNSYHGTLFAVVMEKPFLIIPRHYNDPRFLSFLKRVGLESRIYSPDAGSINQQMVQPINWEEVRQKKEQFIESSKQFIQSWEL